MEIDANNSIAIHHFLSLAEDQGWNWAAFDWPSNGQVDNFHGFESADEAVKFCEQANTNFDSGEQTFTEAHYHYTAIETLREAMQPHFQPDRLSISMESLTAQLTAQGVGLIRSHDRELLLPAIQTGTVFPVTYDREINPEKEIERFIVVAHHHAGHQVYEVGHSVKVMDEFDTLEKAEQYFAGLIRQDHDNTDQHDYQLIGLYRGFDYKSDMEGTPENYSGLTLTYAFYQYDPDLKAKMWLVENHHKFDQPKNIQHFLYAQYDAQNNRFKLLDDRLKETRPQDIKISTYPSYFINEKLTTKQLNIMMNEPSYDYVKNQLLYLGFGEEIANPLKEKMEQGPDEFILKHSKDFGPDKTSSVLHFGKGDDMEKDMTFFDRLEMTLSQPGKEDLTQIFFIGKEYNYTLQERYNMMDGRFVFREQPRLAPVEENGQIKYKPTGETYLGWKGLNFKETHEDGSFKSKVYFWRHDKEIIKYPLKEVTEPYDRNRLLASMQKGNKANVTISRNDQEIKGTVVANPRMQRFDFYDENGQSLYVRQVEKQKLVKTENVEQRQQQNQHTGKKEGLEQNQQPGQQQDKNNQTTQQELEKSNNLSQDQLHKQEQDKKESQKTGIADEQKNNTGQHKKRGVYIK